MAAKVESLFSLELVAEKLYLPYVTCRFPAVAFRLLDFPTILINHVEQDLANTIRRKIKRDPYYDVPNQFSELQDKEGNFMVKKGKSCLFKLSPETLKMHLSNTPMYLMVIDEYPEVPKLLGNSSIPLDKCMDGIFSDIKKNGHTVPSVHGDKGLFKIYSLMGTEIGYIVLGFRLLSLGPGLIAHLPASAIAKRTSETKKSGQVTAKEVQEEIILEKRHGQLEREIKKSKDSASMTEVATKDVLMQTMEINDERVHIEISAPELKKESQTICTQTGKRRPKHHISEKILQKFTSEESEESEDEILINPNVQRPPPLFYNSKAEPKVEIERGGFYNDYSESTFDDVTVESLSDEEIKDVPTRSEKDKNKQEKTKPLKHVGLKDAKTIVISNVQGANINANNNQGPQIPNIGSAEPVFPLLTALLTELSKIQNPQLVNQAMAQVQSNAQPYLQPSQAHIRNQEEAPQKQTDKGKEKDDMEKGDGSHYRKGKKTHHSCAHPHEHVPKQKGWIRQAPNAGAKKTKLIFGLTNTQRLRLAKQNPNWLKTAEQDEKIIKAQRQKLRNKNKDEHLETGNLSDTFTEVRRLAAAELETTAASTMKPDFTIQEPLKNQETKKPKKKFSKSRDKSPGKIKSLRKRSRSPKGKQKRNFKKDDGTDNEIQELGDTEQEVISPDGRLDSAADSMPSSKIEVRIPSAKPYESEETYDTDQSDNFEETPVSSRKETHSKFPGFNNPNDTLPESIDGNRSSSQDEDSPLESTRVSKQFTAGVKDSNLFRSTEDYDTKQFQSTDEPELQYLISEEEKSDTFEITPTIEPSAYSPSMSKAKEGKAAANRLSMKFEVINPKASLNSPLPSLRRSTVKIDSINARPSPTGTPRSRSSGPDSPKQPTPRPRKPLRERRIEFKKESIHTESVSSYLPSESENILSLLSDGSYSDDFHMSSERDASSRLSTPDLPKLIPSTKLGYTIS